jgi:hypothetical protein
MHKAHIHDNYGCKTCVIFYCLDLPAWGKAECTRCILMTTTEIEHVYQLILWTCLDEVKLMMDEMLLHNTFSVKTCVWHTWHICVYIY